MCDYSILVSEPHACVRYCHDCRTYTLIFNNLSMSFDKFGFGEFKDGLQACYEDCICTDAPRNRRDIYFNTRLSGIQLLFSLHELGDLISIMQEATIQSMTIANN